MPEYHHVLLMIKCWFECESSPVKWWIMGPFNGACVKMSLHRLIFQPSPWYTRELTSYLSQVTWIRIACYLHTKYVCECVNLREYRGLIWRMCFWRKMIWLCVTLLLLYIIAFHLWRNFQQNSCAFLSTWHQEIFREKNSDVFQRSIAILVNWHIFTRYFENITISLSLSEYPWKCVNLTRYRLK